MNDWISVKNEVPYNDDKVLVVNMGLTDIARYEEGKWFSLIFNYFMEDGSITHWMTLPEPPKVK